MHRSFRLLRSVAFGCALAVGSFGLTAAAAAQQPSDATATPAADFIVRTLAAPSGLDVHAIFLDVALRELHRSSRIPLLFSPSLLPADHKVTCACGGISVADALDRLLAGTGLEYVVEGGQVVIAPAAGGANRTEAVAAPVIRGRLVEKESGSAIPGAFVLLFDETGERRTGSLTDDVGRFELRTAGPGRYTLKAERIGYRTQESAPLQLSAGEILDYRLVIPVEAVALAGILVEAEARRQCVIRPEQGLLIAQLWEESRKAFRATAVSAEQGLYRFRVRHIERRLEPGTLRVLEERIRARALVGDVPFISRAPEDLVERGFIQTLEDDTYFYAPDAGVLLSERFAETHCFRLVDGPRDEPDLIGVGFQPVRGHRVPGIRGVLWLDRSTGELRHLEYRYAGIPFDIPGENLGGRVEFQRLESGAWIIPRWWIRTPYLASRRVMMFDRIRTHLVLVAIKEEGAEIVDVQARADGVVDPTAWTPPQPIRRR